jgi:two-component system OmpR family response regulator
VYGSRGGRNSGILTPLEQPNMHNDEIYGLSPAGENELRSSATALTPAEIDLLIRIDPTLTVGQLKSVLAPEAVAPFEAAFQKLRLAGLIERVQLDTFAMQLESALSNFAQAVNEDQREADAGVRSLQRAGFYLALARKQARTAPPPTGQPLTAVVVEDDPNLSKFVSSYLAFAGFAVRTAANRAEVLAQFRKPPVPNVVLLDVMLPDVNGFEVLASLRRHPAFRSVPIVMLTGKATREAVLQGLAGGADGYITKPFEPDALMAAVRTVLGLPEPVIRAP